MPMGELRLIVQSEETQGARMARTLAPYVARYIDERRKHALKLSTGSKPVELRASSTDVQKAKDLLTSLIVST